jgi:hypothetical protein
MNPIDFARRAALPEVMFAEDVALALQLDCSAAEQFLLRGECGPVVMLEDRPAILRSSFMAALAAQQFDPASGLRSGESQQGPEVRRGS